MGRLPKLLLSLFALGGLTLVSLYALVRQAEVRTAQVTRSHPPQDSELTWIANVSVFDGQALLRNRDVLLRGATIVSVTEAGSHPLPGEALRINGNGKTLLPGLIDSHAHLLTSGAPPWGRFVPKTDANARAMLYAGVTSVLVAQSGAEEDQLIQLGETEHAAVPHLFPGGPGLTAPGGHPIPFVRALIPWPLSSLVISRQPVAATVDEAKLQVSLIHGRHHPPLFKIFFDAIPKGAPHLSVPVLESTVKAARELGMRPVVHIGSSADMVTAAEVGVALLMHPPSSDELTDEQVATLAKIGTPFVTTMRTLLAADEVRRTGGTQLERESMDARLFTSFASRPQGFAIPGFEEMEKEFPLAAARMQKNVQRLVAAGVPFFVGSDTGVFGVFPGASLHGEMLALARAGIKPELILRAATSAPAAFLDPALRFGRVASGQRADLLLVRGDPVADLHALSEIEDVWLSGMRLKRRPVTQR